MDVDYIIVGQGLAGSVLALTLLANNQQVCVLAHPERACASEVAAGLFNPITGKRMSKTWKAESLFPFLQTYYRQAEKTLGVPFLYEMPIYRPFVSLEEQNTWIVETSNPDIAPFADLNQEDAYLRERVDNPYGGMCIRQTGYLDTSVFLRAARKYFCQLGVYREVVVDYAQVMPGVDTVTYQDIRAKKILFCDGTYTVDNPFFNWLPFRLVKGEILDVEIEDFLTEYIINQHLFVIPLPDHTYRIGATYNWRNLDWEGSEAGKNELLEKASRLIKRPIHVLNHRAGVRPATADRRPLLGMHPDIETIGFFGGMGSKGVSLTPFLAQHFLEFLLYQKEIMADVTIHRYQALYKKNAR